MREKFKRAASGAFNLGHINNSLGFLFYVDIRFGQAWHLYDSHRKQTEFAHDQMKH